MRWRRRPGRGLRIAPHSQRGTTHPQKRSRPTSWPPAREQTRPATRRLTPRRRAVWFLAPGSRSQTRSGTTTRRAARRAARVSSPVGVPRGSARRMDTSRVVDVSTSPVAPWRGHAARSCGSADGRLPERLPAAATDQSGRRSQKTNPSRSTTSPRLQAIGCSEDRAGVDEGVELAVLAAGIDVGRQVGEQLDGRRRGRRTRDRACAGRVPRRSLRSRRR